MKLYDDLPPVWIYVKWVLFFVILIMSAGMSVVIDEKLQRFVLILATIWSSARFYYFMFYVIEKYVDDSYKFSGVLSFLKYLLQKRKSGRVEEEKNVR